MEPDGSVAKSIRQSEDGAEADYWYRQDIRGSITNIVDGGDNVVKSYTYDAYGNTETSGDNFVNSIAYTGAVIDEETGLYYMNARYYEPETGRFVSQDSYRGEIEAFWHLYLYCDGDPVNAIDPTGHKANTVQKYIANSHYRHNSKRKRWLYIYDQKKEAAYYKFGSYTSDYNGCGWIAVFNLLYGMGKMKQPAEIIRDIEYLASGRTENFQFGAKIPQIKKVLKKYGFKVSTYTNRNVMDKKAKASVHNIVKYYWFLGGHYIYMRWDKSKKAFYGRNVYTNENWKDNKNGGKELGKSFSGWLKSHNYQRVTLITVRK